MSTLQMQAVVAQAYGGPEVLSIQEVSKPQPKANEILIQIKVIPVTTADTMIRTGIPRFSRLMLGLTKPKNPFPGTNFAGEVVAVGNKVEKFKLGDAVFGETALNFGAHANYVCLPVDGMVLHKPEELTYEQVASICDGPLTSINFLKLLGEIKAGQQILINGAAGALGSAAVQLAKYYGATVTAVGSSGSKDLAMSLGADHFIDYTKKDFTENHNQYDIIYDTVGKSSFSKAKPALKSYGRYLSPVLSLPLLFQMLWTAKFGNKKALFSATGMMPVPKLKELVQELLPLFVNGNLKTVIDRRYSLEQIAEAHRYVDSGRKKGNVIIEMS
ncbi:MAG: NAD(P)-dependent alcohol dehydrogenase [Bacteroidota bacterium]